MKKYLNRREVFKIIGISPVLLTANACAVGNSRNNKTKPNIVLILSDDQGWIDTSVPMIKGREDTKSDFYQTPYLEKIAKNGMVFSDAYAPAPVCSPTRISIQFGMTPARLHHSTLNTGYVIHTDKLTIPKMFKKVDPDYVTAHFGKWHFAGNTPETAGYHVSDGPTGNGEGDFQDDFKTPLPEDDPKRIFSLTRKVNQFMEKQVKNSKPFYVQLSHYALHVGHQSLKETREKYRKLPRGRECEDRDYQDISKFSEGDIRCNWILNYAAMIENVDTALGILMDKLKSLGIAENTYVIFTSDNGGGFRANFPLRGAKADLTEGGIRVPMIVQGPGVLKGTYCDKPVVGWDFLPTFADIAGNKKPLHDMLDGGSLLPLFKKGNKATVMRGEEALIFHFPWYNGEPESAIRMGDYKLLKNLDTKKLELYNLKKDIEESNDLSKAMPEKVKSLHVHLEKYLKSVDAEDVNTLRKGFKKTVVEQWIPNQEKKVKELLARKKSGKKVNEKELTEAERHLKWLKQQVIFTDERIKMH